MTTTQKALLVKEIGAPLELGTRTKPSPKQGEVLVKVTATMILPHDTYGRDWGLLIDKKIPAVLGANVAGVVEEVGPGGAWEVGKKVFGMCYPHEETTDQGGLQEYSLLNANAIGEIPEGISDEQAVSLPINIATSWIALFTKYGFDLPPPVGQKEDFDYAGTNIVIIGGGTNVGQFAIQLARIAGVGKIIVVAGLSNTERLESMGATHVIDRHGSPQDISGKIHAIVGPEGATRVYTCAPISTDMVLAILPKNEASILRALLPLEAEDEEKFKSKRPLCDASYIADLTNDFMAPHAEEFWALAGRWMTEGKILPTAYEVIEGLVKVEEINKGLDSYRNFDRPGAQVVVKGA